MNFIKILSGVKKVLGKLTDVLIKGRQAGLWDKKNEIPGGGGGKDVR